MQAWRDGHHSIYHVPTVCQLLNSNPVEAQSQANSGQRNILYIRTLTLLHTMPNEQVRPGSVFPNVHPVFIDFLHIWGGAGRGGRMETR